MYGVFIGEHDNKIDTKGRVSIPADFRRVIEEGDPKWEPGKNATMAIVYGDAKRNYLEVFPVADLLKVLKAVARMPRGSAKSQSLRELYAQKTLYATLDDTGRIVLSAKLREKLGLTDMAKVVGSVDTFEIWNPASYDTEGVTNLKAEDDFDPDLDASVWLAGDVD
ncbi:division/cell wall cluster transcriptional repressor MraZ [Oceaniglobus indicus]|uniref:division/cell wall cluster transcriptional repressor MraZ n=1 Tax=Oceaniglobus indicus TaxID=2047749 RepID=UPI000C187077|nr:cell division/cell wall cluster transcriptional repressor MraZ [Oceaniglobus indicus]